MGNQSSPKVFAHVVTYNNEDTIVRCLESLAKQEGFELWKDLFVYITDNDSADNTVKLVEKHFEGTVRVRKNVANLGFSLAHNDGIQYGLTYGVDYALVLNPDLRLEPDALKHLVNALERDKRAGVAFPQLIRADNELNPLIPRRYDSTGMYITPSLRHFDRAQNEVLSKRYDKPQYLFGGSGAALLLRKHFILDCSLVTTEGELQLFDDSFFAYREDADLAWRSQWLGWRARYVPESVGYHKRVVTHTNREILPAELNYHGVRNRFLLQLNNFSFVANFHCIIPGLIRNIIVIAGVLIKERSSLPGLEEALAQAPQALEYRRRLLERRRVEPSEMSLWFSYTPSFQRALSLTPAKGQLSSIAVIIVNFNSGPRLKLCLESLIKYTDSLNYTIKFIVVDNNSADESVSIALGSTEIKKQVTIINSDKNLGFAGAINLAAKENASADALLILNPDIEISQGALTPLVSALNQHSNLAAVAPVLTSSNGELQSDFSIRDFPTLGSILCELFYLHRLLPENRWTKNYLQGKLPSVYRYLSRQTTNNQNHPHDCLEQPLVVNQPAGAALLVRNSVFKELGGFDEAFFPAWFEDVDFCKRLADKDYCCAVVSSSRAKHEGGYSHKLLSPARFAAIWYPNLLLYSKKHSNITEYIALRLLFPVAMLFRAAITALDAVLPVSKDQLSSTNKLLHAKTLLALAFTGKARTNSE
jgi:GT2 family glycosyltransferase